MLRALLTAVAGALLCGITPASASVLEVRYEVETEIYVFGFPYQFGHGPPHGSGIITLRYQAPASLPSGTNGANVQPIAGPVSLSPARSTCRTPRSSRAWPADCESSR